MPHVRVPCLGFDALYYVLFAFHWFIFRAKRPTSGLDRAGMVRGIKWMDWCSDVVWCWSCVCNMQRYPGLGKGPLSQAFHRLDLQGC